MRLFLLPISARRTLIYCERVPASTTPGQKPPIAERIITRASETWAKWEAAEKGWQKYFTVQGNKLFRRIPYEEWGLKSLPPGTKKRLEEIDGGQVKFECLFPGRFMEEGSVGEVLRRLGVEREAFHRRNLWRSVAWMPITIPFAIVPVIPNIPFFYAAFRAYSHYRALYGGYTLSHLVTNNLIKITDSPIMDELYTAGLLHPSRAESRASSSPTSEQTARVAQAVRGKTQGGREDVMMLQRWNGKLIAERFKLPEMEVEIERAVEQVERVLEKEREVAEGEKKEDVGAAVREKVEEVKR